MRWIKWTAAVVLLLVLVAILGLPRLNDFQRGGRLALSGLQGEVRVVRDEKGMAYIHATDENDLIRAQGFVTAQVVQRQGDRGPCEDGAETSSPLGEVLG